MELRENILIKMKRAIYLLFVPIAALVLSCDTSFDEVSAYTDFLAKAEGGVIFLGDAMNVDTSHGIGEFGDGSRRYKLTDSVGKPLSYSYEDLLTDTIYDPNAGGPFNPDRYFRIIENGINISDGAGLNLDVRAWDLTNDVNPPGNECYVDPDQGKFILPRPSYWSTMDSEQAIDTPEISVPGFTSYYDLSSGPPSYRTHPEGKLVNCDKLYGSAFSNANADIYPFGDPGITTMGKGVISLWALLDKTIVGGARTEVFFGNNSSIFMNTSGNTVDVTVDTQTTPNVCSPWDDHGWHHIYLVWDTGGSLAGGTATVILYVDNAQVYCENISFSPASIYIQRITSSSVGSSGTNMMDNLKIWNHVVSEDPSWIYDYEYDSGDTGTDNPNDDALHEIYGSDSNYRPVLNGGSSGVGFHYVIWGFM